MARNTVKLILLDRSNHLLLLQGQDPATGTHHWYPVGGGVEPGESLAKAAAREAWEETGLKDLVAGPLVWTRDVTYECAGHHVEVHEDWLLCQIDHFDPAPAALTDFEQLSVRQLRWWSPAELLNTSESIYPPDLGARLDTLLTQGVPSCPVNIGS